MDSSANLLSRPRNYRAVVRLLRPKQWIKNGFVLAPLVFTGRFTDAASLTDALLATLLFCIGASAVYIVNDLKDIDYDRAHASKSRQRPLATGEISPRQALQLLAGLYLLLLLGLLIQPQVVVIILAYILLNLAYTFVLKHQPVVDIFTIAIGFVMRVYAGAVALEVPLSSWMFVTTLCLALYLAAVKRRQELKLGGSQGRQVLERYSVVLLDRYAEMAATGALLFYSLYVMTARPELVITIPVVLFGLFRYWYVVEFLDGGESPTDALVEDWQLMATVAAWVVLSASVIL